MIGLAGAVVVLVDEGTLAGTGLGDAAAAAYAEVAPSVPTEVRIVRAGDARAVAAALAVADVLVILPTETVLAAPNPGPHEAATRAWVRAAPPGAALIVEPLVAPGQDAAVRQEDVRDATDALVAEVVAGDLRAARLGVGSTLAGQPGTVAPDGTLTSDGSALLACLIVAATTGRAPSLPTPALDAACVEAALAPAVPPSTDWRPWRLVWGELPDAGGSRWVGEPWLAPLVAVSGGVDEAARDVGIAVGQPALWGRLDVLVGSLVVGDTLGLGATPEVAGGRATLRVGSGGYVQAGRLELGPPDTAVVLLEGGEIRAGTLSAPWGLDGVAWSTDDVCAGRLGAARVEDDLLVEGCFVLPRDARLDGALEVADGGVLHVDARGGVVAAGAVTVRGTFVVDGVAPTGPIPLLRAPSIGWTPAGVTIPGATRLRVEPTTSGDVLWLELPDTPAPTGPFAPSLLPPAAASGCRCDAGSGGSGAIAALATLAFFRRRRLR